MHARSTLRFLFLVSLGLSLCLQVSAQQAPTRESLGAPGPYQVSFYTELPDVPEYGAATLYFPANKGDRFGGVAIAPGFIEQQENIDWWGQHLASHGFAVIVLDTNTPRDDPALRAEALMAAIGVLRSENSREGGMLRGKIDGERMAVMGHSMGGGGTLLAANAHSDELKAAIPFTPWLPNADFSSVAVPTLVLAGELDNIAAADTHAWPHFGTLPDSLTRMYVEIKGGNHFIANSDVENERLKPNMDVHDLVGYLGVAWLKLFVDGDERYRDLVFGEMAAQDMERISRFEVHP